MYHDIWISLFQLSQCTQNVSENLQIWFFETQYIYYNWPIFSFKFKNLVTFVKSKQSPEQNHSIIDFFLVNRLLDHCNNNIWTHNESTNYYKTYSIEIYYYPACILSYLIVAKSWHKIAIFSIVCKSLELCKSYQAHLSNR